MSYALISPEEKVFDYDNNFIGQRVAQICPTTFEIAPPLFWVPFNGDENADWYYDGSAIQPMPVKPLAPAQNAPAAPDGGPQVVA